MNDTAPKDAASLHRELLTLPETAQRLQIGRTTLHKLIAEGLPVIEISGRRVLRVSSAALDEWLAVRTTSAARGEATHAG